MISGDAMQASETVDAPASVEDPSRQVHRNFAPEAVAQWCDRAVARGGLVHPAESSAHAALALMRIEALILRESEVLQHIAHSLDRLVELATDLATPGRKRGT